MVRPILWPRLIIESVSVVLESSEDISSINSLSIFNVVIGMFLNKLRKKNQCQNHQELR